MTSNISRDCFVYPGEYTPLPEVEALLEKINSTPGDVAQKLPVNMNESHDCYNIEVIMPGVKREDIIILVNDNILSIVVLHKDREDFARENLQIHEFDPECLERHILLPENAGLAFICAEYKGGVLSLHIPKTGNPQKKLTNRIVVY